MGSTHLAPKKFAEMETETQTPEIFARELKSCVSPITDMQESDEGVRLLFAMWRSEDGIVFALCEYIHVLFGNRKRGPGFSERLVTTRCVIDIS